MPHKKGETIPLRRLCINLRDGDYEWLKTYGEYSPSETIRLLVIKLRKTAEERANKAHSIHDLQVNVEDL